MNTEPSVIPDPMNSAWIVVPAYHEGRYRPSRWRASFVRTETSLSLTTARCLPFSSCESLPIYLARLSYGWSSQFCSVSQFWSSRDEFQRPARSSPRSRPKRRTWPPPWPSTFTRAHKFRGRLRDIGDPEHCPCDCPGDLWRDREFRRAACRRGTQFRRCAWTFARLGRVWRVTVAPNQTLHLRFPFGADPRRAAEQPDLDGGDWRHRLGSDPPLLGARRSRGTDRHDRRRNRHPRERLFRLAAHVGPQEGP